jgi:hypothetical protein
MPLPTSMRITACDCNHYIIDNYGPSSGWRHAPRVGEPRPRRWLRSDQNQVSLSLKALSGSRKVKVSLIVPIPRARISLGVHLDCLGAISELALARHDGCARRGDTDSDIILGPVS